jgi:hypothetical protein
MPSVTTSAFVTIFSVYANVNQPETVYGTRDSPKESLYPIFVFMNYYTIVYTGIKEKGFLFGSLASFFYIRKIG